LAEYRDHYETILAAGSGVAGLAVDPPEESEALRRQLALPFPLLCDSQRKVLETWGLLNAREKGGIARPAVFVIDRDLRVRFVSLDLHSARVRTEVVVNFLLSGMATKGPVRPRRRLVFPTLGDWFRALRNTFRFGPRSPKR
jgi:peroxiredoxin